MEALGVGLDTFGLTEEASVVKAIDIGYELVVVGENYGNLALVGAGLKKCSRKPYVIVKLSGMPSGDYQDVQDRLDNILSQLDIKCIDLCLIGWPGLCTWDPTDMSPLASEDAFKGKKTKWEVFCDNIGPAWSNMVKLREDGMCAQIGTSNFYAEHLIMLKKKCSGAIPFANEIFMSATTHEGEFVEDLLCQGIKVLAYNAVASKPFPDHIDGVVSHVGEGASPQNVILAWFIKRGIWPLVNCKSDHIDEDVSLPMKIKDKLCADDLLEFRKADVGRQYSREWFARIWGFHIEVQKYTEEAVQQLVKKGVDEEKARSILQKTNGDVKMAAFYCGC